MHHDIIQKASAIPTLTEINERELLAELAAEVPPTNYILEIGALYGGVTAVLALAAPSAYIYTIDNFSWHPEGFPKTSRLLLETNLFGLDIKNVTVIDSTSKQASKIWQTKVYLLWIDGGHDFKTVYFDLFHFSQFAEVIALHDYDNPAWKDIRQAVETFLSGNEIWYLDQVVGTVAVLRKRKQ